tara:strand:- start:836 stop:1072 length:237 start_codon:yes stop_codon:yes gene_type:complete
MEIDKIELQKIIEQEIVPNENIITWSDVFLKAVKKTLDEQVLVHHVDPELAKKRIIKYITERLEGELNITIYTDENMR